MSTTPSLTTAAPLPSGAQAGTTTFNPVITQSVGFLGWASVADQAGIAVYSPVDCGIGSSLSASSTFATCCPIAGAGCPLYTSCGNSVLYGPQATSVCAAGAVCKTDVLHDSAAAGGPTSVFFCNSGAPTSLDFYRALPTPGFVYGQSSSGDSNDPLASKPVLGPAAIGGVAVGGVIFLLICAGVIFCCRKLLGGPRVYVEPIPMTAQERKRANRKAAENEVKETALRNHNDRIEEDRRWDVAARLNN